MPARTASARTVSEKSPTPRKPAPRKSVPKKAGSGEFGPALNLCLVRGECSPEPELRVLASGTRLATLSVRVRSSSGPATSVPVAVWDPSARIEALEAGTEVVVVGRVVRRFFRTASGGPGSRVEVQADLVAPADDKRKLVQALRRAERVLDALVDDGA